MERTLGLLFATTLLLNAADQPSKDHPANGRISNRGVSATNASTPLGRYQKIMWDAIGSIWYRRVSERSELVTLGSVEVSLLVDPTGHIKNLKVIKNSSNEAFASVCLQSILDVKLPPIPKDAVSVLPAEGLRQELTFTMFPNSTNPGESSSKPSVTATPAPKASNDRQRGGR